MQISGTTGHPATCADTPLSHGKRCAAGSAGSGTDADLDREYCEDDDEGGYGQHHEAA